MIHRRSEQEIRLGAGHAKRRIGDTSSIYGVFWVKLESFMHFVQSGRIDSQSESRWGGGNG